MPLSGSRPLPGSLVDKTLSISSSTSPYHGDFRSHLPQLRELLHKMSNEHGIQLHHSSHMTAQLLKWNNEFTSSPTKATQKRGKVTLPFSGLCQSLLKSWVYYPSPPPPQILKVFSSVSVEWETLIRQSTTWGRMWRVPTLVMTWRPGIMGTLKTEKEALLCMN